MDAQINAIDRRMDLYFRIGGGGGPGPPNFMIGEATAPPVPTPLHLKLMEVLCVVWLLSRDY